MAAPLILLSRHYDRVSALESGRVLINGERPQCEVMPTIPETFKRLMNDDNVLAGEMSFGFQVAVASSDPNSRFMAIPVFLSRSFRHGNVFVRKNSHIEDFSQLKGMRVGLEEYAMTMGVWVRGLFEQAGVMPEDIKWYTARNPVVIPEVEAKLRQRLSLQKVNSSIWDLLEKNEIDAVIGRPPDYRDVTNGPFRQLLRDHWTHQRKYFSETKIFPTMHVLVVRRDAYAQNPQIALDLFNAFEESKKLAIEDMRSNLNALTVSLPMLEAHVDETVKLFGDDWWPYGLKKNLAAVTAFTSYCLKQGVVYNPVTVEMLFCPNTLDL